MTEGADPEVLSIEEAAGRLGVGVNTLYALERRGESPVPVQRIGRTMKVLRSDVDAYLAPGPRAAVEGLPPNAGEFIGRHIRQLRLEADELERWLDRHGGATPKG